MYNYSDVTKTASRLLGQGIESDLTNVFGVEARSVKALKSTKTDIHALWESISSFRDQWTQPEWVDQITDYD